MRNMDLLWGCALAALAGCNASTAVIQDDTGTLEWTQIESNGTATCALRSDSAVACWGPPLGYPVEPLTIDQAPPKPWVDIALGTWHLCAVSATGEVGCITAQSQPAVAERAPTGDGYTRVECDEVVCCAVHESGTAECWGTKEEDDEFYAGILAPQQGDFVAVDVDATFACGVETDGTMSCWGREGLNLEPRNPAGTHWVDVSMDDHDICGLRDDGTAECWTQYDHDLDGWPNSSVPFTKVLTQGGKVCALEEAGWVRCRQGDRSVDVAVGALDGASMEVSDFALGDDYGCGMGEQGGEVLSWGDPEFLPAKPLGGEAENGLEIGWW